MSKKIKIALYSASAICVVFLILIIIAVFGRFSGTNAKISANSFLLIVIGLIVILALMLDVLALVLLKYPDDSIVRKSKESRFAMLTEIDNELEFHRNLLGSRNLTLEEMCEEFRSFSAAKLNLYYSIDDIRKFVAGLAVSHIIILQGMSGTGKTSLAYAFGKYLENDSTIIPVQPMWKERTDLIGYYNEFTKKFNETLFLQKLYEASYKDDIYLAVLDEMNIARVEYYFAEFLSLLEIPNENGRYLDVVSEALPTDPKNVYNGQLKLPRNMWFIGTANNDDSTFSISDKVYDRAMIMNLDKKAEAFDATTTRKSKVTYTSFMKLVDDAERNYRLRFRNKKRIQDLDDFMQHEFHFSFGNRIRKQIEAYVPVYIACGGSENEALDDIISKKIIRKLEGQNSVYLKKKSKDLMDYLDDVFGRDTMVLCKEAINTICKG